MNLSSEVSQVHWSHFDYIIHIYHEFRLMLGKDLHL